MHRAHEESRLHELRIKNTAGLAPVVDTVELALLEIDLRGNQDFAISLLRKAIAANPEEWSPRLWLAYHSVYAIMSRPAIEEAMHITTELASSTDESVAAAALVVLYGALNNLEDGVRIPTLKVACLESSVMKRPGWVSNRLFLAVQYRAMRRYADALRQISVAITNVLPEPGPESYVERQFEISMTGRLSHRVVERSLMPLEREILRERLRHPDLGQMGRKRRMQSDDA